MSRFYGSMRGSRGETTRCGTPSSGVTAHVRGWDVGIHASVDVCPKCGGDQVQAYLTGGSNGGPMPDVEIVYCPTCDGKK